MIEVIEKIGNIENLSLKNDEMEVVVSTFGCTREFDSCLHFFTNQIAQNIDYINAFEFFYCQICENKCTNMG